MSMQRVVLALSSIAFLACVIACGGGPSGPAPAPGVTLDRTGGPPDTTDAVVEGEGKPFIIGGLSVEVRIEGVGIVPLAAGGKKWKSQEECLILRVNLTSADPGKRFDYATWAKTA